MDDVLTEFTNMKLEDKRPPKITIPERPPTPIPSSSNAPMHEPVYRRRALVDYLSHVNTRIKNLRSRLLTTCPKETVDRDFITETVLETAQRYGLEHIRVPRARGLEEAGVPVGDRRAFYQARLREHNEKILYTRSALELELEELQNIRDQILTEMSAYTTSR